MGWQAYIIIGVLTASAAYWQRRPLLFWLMDTRFWAWTLNNIIRKLRVPWGVPRMTATKYRAVRAAVKPGSILLGTKAGWLANRLTPGLTSHGALYIGNDRVAETVAEGDTTIDLLDFCFHYSRVIVAECTDWDEDYVNSTILPESLKLEGTKYDHAFKPGHEALYCYERIEAVDTDGRLKFAYEFILRRPVVTGDSILKARNVRVLVDTDNLTTGA